jgi:hypothetical protein
MDGTFTVTLGASSGNRTVTQLTLTRGIQSGVWDTVPNDAFWVLGAASTLNGALLNAANGTVNFPLTAGSSFKVFASDFQSQLFVAGSSFTLTVNFADGSTATASVVTGTSPGTLQFSATSYSVAENVAGGNAAITVTRAGGGTGAVGVSFATSNGTATAGLDYTTVSQTLSFANGDTTAKTVNIPIIDDTIFEGNETVNLTLSNPTGGATLGSPGSAVLTIVDNEAAPPASISLSYDGQVRDRVGQGETALSGDGAMDGTFTVTLGAGSGNRTVTQLNLTRSNQSGIWDTVPGNGFWVLGAASTLDGALLNAANGTVNFPLTAGSSFKIFASDFQSQLFVAGSSFTLTVNFADGSTATASATIVAPNPVPTLTSLAPNSATAGGAAFTLTVNGTNFISSSTVQWNGSNRSTTFVSATQVTAAIPASDIAAAGTAQVTVVNPAPGGGTSNGLTFTIGP